MLFHVVKHLGFLWLYALFVNILFAYLRNLFNFANLKVNTFTQTHFIFIQQIFLKILGEL